MFHAKDIKSFDLISSQDRISEVAIKESAARRIAPGTILVVGRMLARTLPVGIVRQPSAFNQDIKAIVPNDRFDAEFVALFLMANQSHVLKEGVKKGPTVNSLISGFIENLEIPNYSLVVQRRIAARLKAQLAEVETARQAAQAQANDITLLRDRVLHAAFNELQDKAIKPLGEWVVSYRNGFGRRPGAQEAGPIVLRIADVSSGKIDLSAPRRGFVTDKEAVTYRLLPNDLLFIRVNGTREIVGRCCVVDEKIPADTILQ